MRAAIRMVRSHASLANGLNERSDPPRIFAEDVIELSEEPQPGEMDLDLSFYPEDEDEDE